jgi:hypothetical protein
MGLGLVVGSAAGALGTSKPSAAGVAAATGATRRKSSTEKMCAAVARRCASSSFGAQSLPGAVAGASFEDAAVTW